MRRIAPFVKQQFSQRLSVAPFVFTSWEPERASARLCSHHRAADPRTTRMNSKNRKVLIVSGAEHDDSQRLLMKRVQSRVDHHRRPVATNVPQQTMEQRAWAAENKAVQRRYHAYMSTGECPGETSFRLVHEGRLPTTPTRGDALPSLTQRRASLVNRHHPRCCDCMCTVGTPCLPFQVRK